MFNRLELLIGKQNLEKVKTKHIVILGLGGVGGYVLEALIRSGIENVTIIDHDKIDITNLNRQIIALNTNIGKLKVDEAENRVHSINKNVKLTKINDFIDSTNIDSIFSKKIDYFIDACDTIKTKELVIKKCIDNKIPFITCLGTGKRLNPEMLTICDIRKTSYDPIAKTLRKYIKESNIKNKIMCCYSKEIPIKINSKDIPSNSFVPASAGLLIASYIIKEICNN